MNDINLPSSLLYKTHQIPTLKRFSYRLPAVFAESFEARCQVENEDVVGAAPTGDAPTTSEWSTILLPSKVRLILEVLWYMEFKYYQYTTKPRHALRISWNIPTYSVPYRTYNISHTNTWDVCQRGMGWGPALLVGNGWLLWRTC